jgi:cell division protease FtsH
VALGGRAAEKIVFNDLTSGAQEDIEKASTIARKMVCEWGMSEVVGPLAFGPKEEQIFLGREIAQHRDYSEQTAVLIDREVRAVVEEALARSEKIVAENLGKLKDLAAALLEREILDREEIEKVLRGEKLPAPVREPSANARNAKRAAAKAAAAGAVPAAPGAGVGGAEILPAPEGLFGQPDGGPESSAGGQAS